MGLDSRSKRPKLDLIYFDGVDGLRKYFPTSSVCITVSTKRSQINLKPSTKATFCGTMVIRFCGLPSSDESRLMSSLSNGKLRPHSIINSSTSELFSSILIHCMDPLQRTQHPIHHVWCDNNYCHTSDRQQQLPHRFPETRVCTRKAIIVNQNDITDDGGVGGKPSHPLLPFFFRNIKVCAIFPRLFFAP